MWATRACRASLSKLWTSLWLSTKAESLKIPTKCYNWAVPRGTKAKGTRDLDSYSHLPWQSAIREANLLLIKKCRLLNSASNWMLHPCWPASDTFPTANVREKIGTGRASHSRLPFFFFSINLPQRVGEKKNPISLVSGQSRIAFTKRCQQITTTERERKGACLCGVPSTTHSVYFPYSSSYWLGLRNRRQSAAASTSQKQTIIKTRQK